MSSDMRSVPDLKNARRHATLYSFSSNNILESYNFITAK